MSVLPLPAPAPLHPLATGSDSSAGILAAAHHLLPDLERGRRIDAVLLRAAMEHAFGGSDAAGAWDWKTAYEACEAATVLFLRKFGPAIRAQATSPAGVLRMLGKVAALLPTHTRRSQESQALQQFSTPVGSGVRRLDGGCDHPKRRCPRAIGWHRHAGDPRRVRWRPACPERAGRHPRRAAGPALSRRRCHPA